MIRAGIAIIIPDAKKKVKANISGINATDSITSKIIAWNIRYVISDIKEMKRHGNKVEYTTILNELP